MTLLLQRPGTDFSSFNQERLSRFIEDHCGIKMPADKRMLLMNRLSRRLKELGLNSYDDYCDYFFQKEDGDETVILIDAITTNKTEFFRERATFQTLEQALLPDMLPLIKSELSLWSAACASGEEPYSLSMQLALALPEVPVSILASDISTGMLEHALKAVYRAELLEQIPEMYHKPCLLFPRDNNQKSFRVAPEIRSRVHFCRINLMEHQQYPDRNFHFIFCRNVLIYFDHQNRKNIVERLSGRLVRGGYLIIGNSESLLSIDVALKITGPGIYRKV
ncbi:MAG: protein-glutamate O-methyltransferase CheR [Spirochaetales bacterium]|nr:protein-glutamate O-methyltransferase CheR [Spirochaetales bacterium]